MFAKKIILNATSRSASGSEWVGNVIIHSECTITYFAKDVLSNPKKASNAPPTAVFLQPKRSVNMLTTGEQRKIMPMAKAPTQAGEGEEKGGRFIMSNT